jgi:TPR repeat protein
MMFSRVVFVAICLFSFSLPCFCGVVEESRIAAEAGNGKAQFKLGLMYAEGKYLPRDDAEAVKWYRKAADQGNSKAKGLLGGMYIRIRDDAEAMKWFRKAAEQGDAKAQIILGRMFSEGQGVPRDDVEAIEWYRKAASQGDAEAKSLLNDAGIRFGHELIPEKGPPTSFPSERSVR